MKVNKNRHNVKQIDNRISRLLEKMEEDGISLEEFDEIMNEMNILIDYRIKLHDSGKKYSIIPDLLKSAVGFAAVLAILNYEKADIITSKAFSIGAKLLGS